jgi:hypothetical protein
MGFFTLPEQKAQGGKALPRAGARAQPRSPGQARPARGPVAAEGGFTRF